ncbi:YbaB/EbfC family nucleoid-associated protein [Mycoplasmatota bacterium]|nr:YbaB/EbfC family nucleoid-associated protein [Mycoplasmatota bacterium]
MLNKLKKMQKEMMKSQQELEESVFVGTAGGVVSVEVKGSKEVLSVKIKPEAVDPEDVNLLEDMILAAMNDAMRQVDEKTSEVMAPYTSGMPGMGGLF